MAKDEKERSRRDFVVSATAGIVAAGGSLSAAAKVVEENVEIKTPDGTCDAAFIHPASGSHPGVVIWADAFGLRPSFREMARRLAGEGYSVLVPNPFYRVAKSPVFTGDEVKNFNFQNPEQRAKLGPLTGSIGAAGNCEKDATAYIEWLDKQKSVNKSKKIGTQGYCMGGPLVVRTCAAVSDRVGAGGSFHGGGLVNDTPNSPHLLASKIKGRMYFGIAANDDMSRPKDKDTLKEAFAAAHVPAEIEVYSMSQHGWCVTDMPKQPNGMPIYNKSDAERAWGKLEDLYKQALA